MSFIVTLFTSGFLAALIAAVVSFGNNERKISAQYITGERAKWRDKIRDKALDVFNAAKENNAAAIEKCYFEFSHLLHLGDMPDDQILENIKLLEKTPNDAERLDDFRIRISLLLKFEWDRAKEEAKHKVLAEPFNTISNKLFKFTGVNGVNRVTFDEFKKRDISGIKNKQGKK